MNERDLLHAFASIDPAYLREAQRRAVHPSGDWAEASQNQRKGVIHMKQTVKYITVGLTAAAAVCGLTLAAGIWAQHNFGYTYQTNQVAMSPESEETTAEVTTTLPTEQAADPDGEIIEIPPIQIGDNMYTAPIDDATIEGWTEAEKIEAAQKLMTSYFITADITKTEETETGVMLTILPEVEIEAGEPISKRGIFYIDRITVDGQPVQFSVGNADTKLDTYGQEVRSPAYTADAGSYVFHATETITVYLDPADIPASDSEIRVAFRYVPDWTVQNFTVVPNNAENAFSVDGERAVDEVRVDIYVNGDIVTEPAEAE